MLQVCDGFGCQKVTLIWWRWHPCLSLPSLQARLRCSRGHSVAPSCHGGRRKSCWREWGTGASQGEGKERPWVPWWPQVRCLGLREGWSSALWTQLALWWSPLFKMMNVLVSVLMRLGGF